MLAGILPTSAFAVQDSVLIISDTPEAAETMDAVVFEEISEQTPAEFLEEPLTELPVKGTAAEPDVEEFTIEDDAAVSYTVIEPIEQSMVNPLYADRFSIEDFVFPEREPSVDTFAFDPNDYYSKASEASAFIRKEMENRVTSFEVKWKQKGSASDNLNNIAYEKLMFPALEHTGVPTQGDYLAHHYVSSRVKLDGLEDSGTLYLTLSYDMEYFTSAAQERKVTQKVNELLKGTLNPNGRNHYQQVYEIYDYICKHVSYDYDVNDSLRYTAYDALINGTSVCQGYATLFYRLALESGIDSRFITGTGNGEPHGWNIVELESKYYALDSTWDATNYRDGLDCHQYFLKGKNHLPNHQRGQMLSSNGKVLVDFTSDEFDQKFPMSRTDYDPSVPHPNDPVIRIHEWSAGYVVVQEPTCKEDGYKAIVCNNCGTDKPGTRQVIPSTGDHTYSLSIVKATPNSSGRIAKQCVHCGKKPSASGIPAVSDIYLSKTSFNYDGKGHRPTLVVRDSKGNDLVKDTDYSVSGLSTKTNAGTYKVTVTLKGSKYSGSKELTWKIKGVSISDYKMTLSYSSTVYSGGAKKPSVTVKGDDGTLTEGTDYKVTYGNNTNVGSATAKVTGQGKYSGTLSKSFKINPQPTEWDSLTAGSKSFTAKWVKQAKQTKGYQIQYATNSDFDGAVTKKVSKASTVSKKISSLTAKKKYYVRIRTYATVNDTYYYSAWTPTKNVTTKS